MKSKLYILSLITIGALLCLPSCKDDPIPNSKVVFSEIAQEVKESNGAPESFHPLLFDGATGREIEVLVTLDRPLAETSVIAFTVEGTAKANGTSNPVGDFEILENSKNLTIQKGESSAKILIQLYEDSSFELDNNDNLFETIIIKLNSVVSGTAEIGDADTFTLTITEDDALVFLDWDDGDGDATSDRGDVDMDAYLFLDGQTVRGAAATGNANLEFYSIPAAFPNGSYGLSYTYYSGTSDALNFTSFMLNFGGTLNGGNYNTIDGAALEFNGDYKLVNINKYDEPDAPDPAVVQSMTKNGFNYTNITEITEPLTGSRIGSTGNFQSVKSAKPTKLDGELTAKLLKLMTKRR